MTEAEFDAQESTSDDSESSERSGGSKLKYQDSSTYSADLESQTPSAGVELEYEAETVPSDESALAVSVDVEDWYHVPAVTGSSFSEYEDVHEFFDEWDDEYDYLTEPTHRTLDLFDDLDITATFFVVADVVDNYPGLVEEIAARGHEIGCHGLHHECAIDPDTKEPRFTRDEYRKQIKTAKRKLEDATGQEVVGFRAPNAYVSGWVLDVLEELGFEYDSSVARSSLYNKTDQKLDQVGTTPYIPSQGSLDPAPDYDRDIVELPWPYYKFLLGEIPTAGGPLIRLFGRRVVQAGVEQSLERGDSVFYFHPIDIARASFPKVGNMKRRPMYWAFKGKTAERRVRKLLNSMPDDRLTDCYTVAKQYEYDITHINK
ncbi:polysaccharide deacetylase family protein [Natrinema sp. 1APR25-10V2]|uniref:polysaccharide deacetylase family protein n=1 Tax=Natrinema sp. 1APR25-10V2 TaxID=2951081 RepID=UPI0028740AC4|nr:polysaccharide deacetylase family protein [Natrinema sp. 1APR25-10V2]MDS0475700.1 polysaccharide deacetylase family protein [Natrinema sp. 1APR25-10V2]